MASAWPGHARNLLEELSARFTTSSDAEVPEIARISDTEWTASGAVGLGKTGLTALAPARVIDVYAAEKLSAA